MCQTIIRYSMYKITEKFMMEWKMLETYVKEYYFIFK